MSQRGVLLETTPFKIRTFFFTTVTSSTLTLGQRIGNGFEFVKFSHTIFALPFALMSMVVAAKGLPALGILFWILVCMVAARTLAMCFNRLADWNLDQENPRTENRHRLMNKVGAQVLTVLTLLLFVYGTLQLNLLCVVLGPVAVGLVTFYSITKRFTAYSHVFLGLALSAAPMGAWAAVTGELWSMVPYLLSLAVLLWVAGFDMIYATMDIDFDRAKGLNSIPARFGVEGALRISRLCHIISVVVFALFGWQFGGGWFFGVAWLLVCAGLVYEHRLSTSRNPTVLNKAFFHVNAFVSVVLLIGVCLDVFLR